MRIHSTCRDCGGSLLVTNLDTVHPLCTQKPTRAERLAMEWLNTVESGDARRENELYSQIEELDNRPPRLMESALTYARWGWPVCPLKPRAKTPATRNGFKDATTDPERIAAWWSRHRDSNIGLPTGIAFDVIDIDVPDGISVYQQLLAEDRAVHGHVVTASGGSHLYIKPTGRGCSTRWKPGADFRGQGGYVVAPPSTLGARGRAWTWLHPPSPAITGMGGVHGCE